MNAAEQTHQHNHTEPSWGPALSRVVPSPLGRSFA